MLCKGRYLTTTLPHGKWPKNTHAPLLQVSLVVRSSLDVFDRFTAKAYVRSWFRYHPNQLCSPVELTFSSPNPDIIVFLCFFCSSSLPLQLRSRD